MGRLWSRNNLLLMIAGNAMRYALRKRFPTGWAMPFQTRNNYFLVTTGTWNNHASTSFFNRQRLFAMGTMKFDVGHLLPRRDDTLFVPSRNLKNIFLRRLLNLREQPIHRPLN